MFCRPIVLSKIYIMHENNASKMEHIKNTIILRLLTLWPWSRAFKFLHTIYVKCEYL
jgi:hypothetical protein